MTPLRVSVAAIRRGPRFFLQRRDPGAARFPGLWEFPGGKAGALETPLEALRRELREELDWDPARALALAPLAHAYADFAVELHPFLCEGPAAPRTALAWGWFTLGEMTRLPMPEASLRLLSPLGLAAAKLQL